MRYINFVLLWITIVHADTLQVGGTRLMMQFTAPCPLSAPQAVRMLSSPLHLEKITNADRITVLKHDGSEVAVRYDFSYLFLKTSMDFVRIFDSTGRAIDFTMCAYSQNNALLPRIASSAGYYRVFPDSNGCEITCRQLTTFQRPLNDFERFVLKTVTRNQIRAIRRYFSCMRKSTFP